MKQLAQYQDGRLELQEVPPPTAPPGGILVRTVCSVISPGTEKMKVEQARMSLLQKAKARPDQVKKVLDTARTLGWRSALEKVRNRLESPSPLGYSAAGVVVAVDEANTRFRVGDRVACGGAECAFHAELIAVPDLLAARVPEQVSDTSAAYTTLAAISMQAVRQSGAGLGDRVVVVGQGLVGQLATAMLAAGGARVLTVDLVPQRLVASLKMGAERVLDPRATRMEDAVTDWSDGQGADAVLICVGGKGSMITDAAIACLRDRGVMVIVGIYDVELSWRSACMKDIQVRYSRSYGPGRYDPDYEWGGKDYPVGYVRWTENRQFEACLHLMKNGVLDLGPVTTREVRFEEVVPVYESLLEPDNADLGVVVKYGGSSPGSLPERCAAGILPVELHSGETPAALASGETLEPRNSGRRPELHVVGAGNFVRTMLLPHLKGKIPLGVVVNQTGLSSRQAKEKFGFKTAETDAAKVLAMATPGAVVIGTRHHLHASQVLMALGAGRDVFVEKPLCLTREQLHEIDAAVAGSRGSVMVGFNRRFAPATIELLRVLQSVPGPRSLAFHVFAGPLAPDHWYANVAESGGRVLGEACHFFDFACCLLGRPTRVSAQTVGRPEVPDSISAQVEFADGSSAQILYSAAGDPAFPKESFRVFAGGVVAEGENFQVLKIHQNRKVKVKKFSGKGHAEEMAAWLSFLNGTTKHPLPYAQSRQSMALTFAALESIRERRMVEI